MDSCVDFPAAFDSVDRQSLWLLLLESTGIHRKLIELLGDLYSNTIRADGLMSEWFPVSAGVRQRCIVAPEMFIEQTDWIAGRNSHRGFLGMTVGREVFNHLDFADDVSIMAEMLEVIILALEIMHEECSSWDSKSIGTRPRYRVESIVPVLGHQVEL